MDKYFYFFPFVKEQLSLKHIVSINPWITFILDPDTIDSSLIKKNKLIIVFLVGDKHFPSQ